MMKVARPRLRVLPIAATKRPATSPRPAGPQEDETPLGDFTATWRMALLSAIAIGIGIVSAGLAYTLLKLITLVTNIAYFGRFSVANAIPADTHATWRIVVMPPLGGLLVGLMARFGSDKIRGHGIPEALEAILLGRSRLSPRVAVLKPVSSAIAIGSGGPFGAEGPIIMTGGAAGSIIGQVLHLTAVERKTLLVAGAAAGMAAVFNAPAAAVVLAIELLLFEWKPRSFVPVVAASVAAAAARQPLLGSGALFPTPPHIGPERASTLLLCALVGLAAAVLAGILTSFVYAAEDGFHRLRVHWMWWPAIGGVAVAIGGLIEPRALGVGYGVIGDLLTGDTAWGLVLGILLVKTSIWAIALGSGTSGGVLAPLLMTGAALGAAASHILPDRGPGFWAIVAMSATLGSAIGAPLTATIFTLELTHDVTVLLPVLAATVIAHGAIILILKRSILTEKLARRGQHLTREYGADPLETTLVRDAMSTKVTSIPASRPVAEAAKAVSLRQALFPVVDADGRLAGVITRSNLLAPHATAETAGDLALTSPVVAYAGEPLRRALERMATSAHTRLPVVERETPDRVVGLISLQSALGVHERRHTEEQVRERYLTLRPHVARAERDPASAGSQAAGD